jgi:hypothetical protein
MREMRRTPPASALASRRRSGPEGRTVAKRNVPEHSCALVVYEKRNAQAKNELRAL